MSLARLQMHPAPGMLLARVAEDVATTRRDAPLPARTPARPLPEALSSSHGAAILDRDHCLVWCNDAAASHLGIEALMDVGRPITHIFRHPSFLKYVSAGEFGKSLRIRPAESDGPILSVQFVPYVASGWLLLSRNAARATRLEIAGGRECIAVASHELRAPLTVMAGFLETMRELKLDPELSRDYLGLLEAQCGRMQRIVTDLLQLSTLESASEPPADALVSMCRMLARLRADAEMLS